MISTDMAGIILAASLAVSIGAYIFVSRREGSYVNLMTPAFVINIPSFYLLPFARDQVFGIDASAHAYVYVYTTLAIENVIFAYFYTYKSTRPLRLPFSYGYKNFWLFSVVGATIAVLLFVPVLLEFREFVFDPRRIYELTRTGFGANFYLSSTAAYLAAIFAFFCHQSWVRKTLIVLVAALVLALHGSKGQVLDLLLFLLLFVIYVKGRKLKLLPALMVCLGLGLVLIGLFAATITLGSPMEALESLSSYSDYTRNAMLVIDSNFPVQYGRLTWESNVIAVVPRAIMPDKPKDYGAFYLDAEFYPSEMERDQGVPAFGMGVQYADFGELAIVYLALFAALRGWLARIFVARLKQTRHPADFIIVAFLAGVTLFPIGIGWPFPETLAIALCLRFASSIGADKVYREELRFTRPVLPAQGMEGV
jgi:hypothetical protein